MCLAAKLDNSYLPPAGAAQSGGGPGLSTPGFGGGGSRPGGGNNALGGTGDYSWCKKPVFERIFYAGRAGPGQGPSASRPSAPNRPSGGAPAAPSGPPIEIISFESENNGDGSYKFSYESANGIKAEEQGEVKNKGSDNEIQSVQGSYSYTSPEGQLISVTYVADENGFVAQVWIWIPLQKVFFFNKSIFRVIIFR